MDHTDDFETISTLSDSGLSNSYSQNKSFRTISPPPEVSRQRKNKKQGEVESVFQEEKETKTTQPEIPSTSKQCIGDNRSPQKQQLLLLQSENMEIPATVKSDIKDGFSCFISTAEGGQIMYVTKSVTKTLGFPKDMLIGRSFADFLHPMDRLTLASHVKNGVIIKKNEPGARVRLPKKSAQEAWMEGQADWINSGNNTVFTMMCRIRRYRGLSGGFAVRNRQVSFMPFMLKLCFTKYICDKERDLIYLLVQATRLFSNFRVPNEIVLNPVPFVMKHAANGDIQYLDPTSIPYLGYTSQDIINKNALNLYHPHDLEYLKEVYKTIVQEDGGWRSKPYRLLAHNGQYVSVETEWCSFINTSSMKLEFVVGKHFIIKGPCNPDIFQFAEQVVSFSKDDKAKFQSLRESIILIMTESLPKPVEAARPQQPKRSHNLAAFLKSLMEEEPQPDEIRLKTEETDSACSNSVLQREDISNRLKDTLQRYFETTSTEFVQRKASPMPESFTSAYPGTLANFSSIKLTESALNKHNWNLEQQDIYKARVFKKKSKKFERKEPGGDNNASIVPSTSSRFVEESDSLPKPVEAARPQEPKRSHNLAAFLKTLMEEEPQPDEIRLKTEETDSACSNSVLQREDISNRLKDTLQRYFDTTSTEFIQRKVSPMPESFTSTYPDTLATFSSIKLTESALKKHNWNLEQQDIYKARVFKKKSKKFERKEPGGDNNASIVPTTSSRFVEESDPNKPKGTPRDSDENDLKVDVPRKNR